MPTPPLSLTENISTYPSVYTHFKPVDPLATGSANGTATYPCFAPNFAVDGKTGNTIQGKGYFRGEVHATSGEFNGVVKVNALYQEWQDPLEDDDYFFPISLWFLGHGSSSVLVKV